MKGHPSNSASLWRHRDFLRLWSAQTVSILGSQVTLVALPTTAVLLLHVSPFQVGVLAAAQYAPYLLFGLPAGVAVDRLRRRLVLVVTDLVRAAVLLLIPIAYALDRLELWMVYLVGFLVGAMSVLFDAAHQAYLPSLVAPDQILEGNTKLELSYSGARFGGAGLGGGLVQALSAPVALLVDAVSYVASAGLLMRIRRRERLVAPSQGPHPRVGPAIREGLRYVFGHRLIRPLAIGQAISGFFDLFGMAGTVLTIFVLRELDLGPAGLGILMAVVSGGAVLGAQASGRLVGAVGLGHVLLMAGSSAGIAVLVFPFATHRTAFFILVPAMLLVGIGNGLFDVAGISLRQAVTPAEIQGRMHATMRFLIWGTIPLGALTGGFLAQVAGLKVALWIAGAGSLTQCIPIALSKVAGLQAIPQPDPARPASGERAGMNRDAPRPTDPRSSPWLSCRERRPEARCRLYCFPHSGGSPGEYLRWTNEMAEIEVIGIQLPGRARRYDEPPYDRMGPLVEALLAAVEFDPPFAFFGHSLGALVAYETARVLREEGRSLPHTLFLSAQLPPHLPLPGPRLHEAGEDALIDSIREDLGLLASDLRADPALMHSILSAYRADLAVAETYAPAADAPLDCRLVVIGGTDDTRAESELAQWRAYTAAGFQLRMLPGDHFYLRDQRASLLRLLAEAMSQRT